MNILKIKIRKEHEKYFAAHQRFSKIYHDSSIYAKIFHDPCKTPPALLPTYLMYGPLDLL